MFYRKVCLNCLSAAVVTPEVPGSTTERPPAVIVPFLIPTAAALNPVWFAQSPAIILPQPGPSPSALAIFIYHAPAAITANLSAAQMLNAILLLTMRRWSISCVKKVSGNTPFSIKFAFNMLFTLSFKRLLPTAI